MDSPRVVQTYISGISVSVTGRGDWRDLWYIQLQDVVGMHLTEFAARRLEIQYNTNNKMGHPIDLDREASIS